VTEPDAQLDALRAEHPGKSDDDLIALLEAEVAKTKPRARGKKGKIAPEPTLLPQKAAEWSVADPGAMDRAIHAVILHGSYEAAQAATGCPADVWLQLVADPKFSDRYRAAVELSLLPGLPLALKEAMASGAYGTKIAFEVARGIKGDEAEAQQARALKSGGRLARNRALIEIIKEAVRQYEVLNGGHTPLPEEIAEIVRSVTTQEKPASAA
jgi:hypothetical protein